MSHKDVSEGTQAEFESSELASEPQKFTVKLTEQEEAEERRNIQLAERARKGDYDDGTYSLDVLQEETLLIDAIIQT